MEKSNKRELPSKQREELLTTLKTRFEKHMTRHPDMGWTEVHARLETNREKLWALNEMETTGGEPDLVGQDKNTGEYVFYDCC